MRTTKRVLTVALSGVVVAGVAACGGSGGGGSTSGSSSSPAGSGTSSSSSAAGAKGGTLYEVNFRGVQHLDPQRIYVGAEISDVSRTVYRTLVTFPSVDGAASFKLTPDLATSTGKATNGAKTWTFTLKKGPKWQDGKAVTCADVQYGISRTFAVNTIVGGPNYAIQFLDIPKKADGSSIYPGPYTKNAKGQAAFDKAVACKGNTITFHLNRPVADFNEALYLPAFAPYRKDQDQGNKSNYSVFSDGPYKLSGKWTQLKGGTFVRNSNWSPDGIRKALPDKIVFQEGIEPEVIASRLIADSGNDKSAVSAQSVPPSLLPKVIGNPAVKARSTNPQSPYMEFIVPNFTSKVMQNKAVRQALGVSEDKTGYITAGGGSSYYTAATSQLTPTTKGFKKTNILGVGDSGDPAKAKSILQKAGVKMPVPITLIYPGGTPTSDKQFSALAAGWNNSGFKVSLNSQPQNYYPIVQDPSKSKTWDVAWSSWGSDWPGASTVIPPLWDSRVNLSKDSSGQDYGRYASTAVNKAIDANYKVADPNKAASGWMNIDLMLQKDYAYIPLVSDKFVQLRGSNITGWIDNQALSDYPDLGSIGVKH